MYSDFKYIVKRVIIGVLICLIIMFIKNQVFAATCSSGTWTLGYIPSGSTSWNTATTIARTLPNGVTRLAYSYTNSNLKTSSFNFTTKVGADLYGYGSPSNFNPSVQIRYAWSGGFTDITTVCAISLSKINISQPDNLIQYRYLYSISCTYTGTNANANQIQIHLTLPYGTQSIQTASYSSMFAQSPDTCLQLSPNSTEQLINSDKENTIIIEDSINNQTDTLHQDNEDIKNELSDNTVSSDTTNQGNAIFSLDIDSTHGLSGVVTAPLILLSKAQEQCTSKSFTIFSKSITLPCGDALFWSKDFSSYHSIFGTGVSGSSMNTIRDNFRTFWNLLFGGAIIFHLLIKLWEVINDTLDPSTDRYESMRSAIDTGSAVRDEDEINLKLDKGSEVRNGKVQIHVPNGSLRGGS